MRFTHLCAASAALLSAHGSASTDKSSEKKLKPCTIESPSSHSFFDLNPISVQLPPEDSKKQSKGPAVESWHAKGYDYGANFTLNFCAPVVEELKDVVGVDRSLWRNISAFYTKHGKTYSLGQQNGELVFRGRKLVLNYTDGSPCPGSPSKRQLHSHAPEDIEPWKLRGDDGDDDDEDEDDKKKHKGDNDDDKKKGKHDDDDDDNDDDDYDRPKQPSKEPAKEKEPVRRKSTLISLLCNKDPLAQKAQLSFVGASPDECTYFFEARSLAACAGAEAPGQDLGPGGVFGVIALIAILVYLVGGCVYQRTVMHQRGWRQLPNYSMWAGIASFIWDFIQIITSSCARLLPQRRGYSRVSLNGPSSFGRGNGRSARAEDENRLIDQLDEEWDD